MPKMAVVAGVAAIIGGTACANSALADCGAISRFGIYDVSSSLSDTDRSLSFRRLFCQQNFQSASEARDFSGSLGLPVGDIPVELGLDSSSQDFRQSYSQFCDDQNYDSKFRERTENLVRRINPAVVQALERCVTQRGLHAWIEQGADGLNFRFKMVFVPASSDDKIPTVANFRVLGATCADPPTHDSPIGPQGYETLCSRPNAATAVAVSLVASSFVIADTPLNLAPVTRPSAPRGPIVIRAVDYTAGTHIAPANGLSNKDGPYGNVLVNWPANEDQPNSAEWRFDTPGGKYNFDVQFAAETPRAVQVIVNGTMWRGAALSKTSGCWAQKCQTWDDLGVVNLRQGENTVQFESGSMFPHIQTLRFRPAS